MPATFKTLILALLITLMSSVAFFVQAEIDDVKISEPMKCAAVFFILTGAYDVDNPQTLVFENFQSTAGVIQSTHIAEAEISRGEVSRLKSEALIYLGEIYDKNKSEKIEGYPVNNGIIKLTEIALNCYRWIGKAELALTEARKKSKNIDDFRVLIVANVSIPTTNLKFDELIKGKEKLAAITAHGLAKGFAKWDKFGRNTPYKFREMLKEKIENNPSAE